MTGSFFVSCVAGITPSSSSDKSELAELILSRCDDQLQHFSGMLICDLCIRVTVPSDLAPFLRLGKQLLLGVGANLHRADLVEAAIDELLGAERATLLQPTDDRLDAGQR